MYLGNQITLVQSCMTIRVKDGEGFLDRLGRRDEIQTLQVIEQVRMVGLLLL